MDYFLNNKKLLLLILAFIILLPFGLFGLKIDPPTQKQAVVPTTIRQITPSVAELSEEDPQKKLLDYLKNRRELSVSDKNVKNGILATLEKQPSGVVYQTSTISIEYLSSADMFQVELLTINHSEAKKEAVSWFLQKGMSSEGICNLPVNFYLNYEIKTQLGEEFKNFNPLPDNC